MLKINVHGFQTCSEFLAVLSTKLLAPLMFSALGAVDLGPVILPACIVLLREFREVEALLVALCHICANAHPGLSIFVLSARVTSPLEAAGSAVAGERLLFGV